MFLKNSTYTTCDILNPDWNLIGGTTELDFEKGVGKSKNVFVTIKGVPVFYSPYMQFSLDDQRKTGFLVPDFSGSWVKGIYNCPFLLEHCRKHGYVNKPWIYSRERELA